MNIQSMGFHSWTPVSDFHLHVHLDMYIGMCVCVCVKRDRDRICSSRHKVIKLDKTFPKCYIFFLQ